MSCYIADLHIHSRYSRATSKALSIPRLAAWAGVKGIDVLATGDFTHPGWLQEIETWLQETDSGLLQVKDPSCLAPEIPWLDESAHPKAPLFILGTEISSIYKSQSQVRKIHNLVFLSSLDKVRAFNRRLGHIGNLEADGRPILGLDSRDLLEMVLETDPWGFLIPAHIWTPWFSLFGSKSGFNSLKDCYRDLSRHIFALETGLSSDPEMNWLLSELDRYTLVSNSDAHSGEKLAREANIFQGEPGYHNLLHALQGTDTSQKFLGSVEFFPEEGKYHMDGHRKCGVVIDPRQTHKMQGLCPVCKTPLTVGVLNRVLNLADRDTPVQPDKAPGYESLIPLSELLAEILGKGPKTKAVGSVYQRLVKRFDSELNVLRHVPPESLRSESQALAEGVARMRRKEVIRQPGFDGQFGQITVFTPEERKRLHSGRFIPVTGPKAAPDREPTEPSGQLSPPSPDPQPASGNDAPNPEQDLAVRAGPHPVLVLAGPGTGKTKTLIGRVYHLLQQGLRADRILVVTFTRAAARELRERLRSLLGSGESLPRADTLHALAFEQWQKVHAQPPLLMSEQEGKQVFSRANPELTGRELTLAWNRLNLERETGQVSDQVQPWLQAYTGLKAEWNLADYTDLLEVWLQGLQNGQFASPYTHVLVDEIQDLSPVQGDILRALLPDSGHGFFGIGDPNQSIYGFRGAMGDVSARLQQTWPDLEYISLHRNYRSSQNVLDLAAGLCPHPPRLQAQNGSQAAITWYQAHSGAQEAAWVAEQTAALIGGTSHLDADRNGSGGLSPGDIAVLVRIKALIPVLEQALTRRGLPCAVPEQTPFWEDERVQIILGIAARSLGLPFDQAGQAEDCPQHLVAQGPRHMASALESAPSFDHLFWTSQAFKDLEKAYAAQGGWAELLTWIHLERDATHLRHMAQKIRIMTLHAAKGLEFEAVFLPALEQGLLPFAGPEIYSGHAPSQPPDPEEERRLLYVGTTRAKQALFLSCAKGRHLAHRRLRLPCSQFVQELDLGSATKVHSVARTVTQEQQLSLFQVGQK